MFTFSDCFRSHDNRVTKPLEVPILKTEYMWGVLRGLNFEGMCVYGVGGAWRVFYYQILSLLLRPSNLSDRMMWILQHAPSPHFVTLHNLDHLVTPRPWQLEGSGMANWSLVSLPVCTWVLIIKVIRLWLPFHNKWCSIFLSNSFTSYKLFFRLIQWKTVQLLITQLTLLDLPSGDSAFGGSSVVPLVRQNPVSLNRTGSSLSQVGSSKRGALASKGPPPVSVRSNSLPASWGGGVIWRIYINMICDI